MAQTQVTIAAKKVRAKPVAKVEEAAKATVAEMTVAESLPVHLGKTPSSFRVSKKLTPLRHNYRCGQMSEKDHGFLHDCVSFADAKGQFRRLNADAGRLGRLYTLQFVTYEEIGINDRDQLISLTSKARDYVKAVTALPKATIAA